VFNNVKALFKEVSDFIASKGMQDLINWTAGSMLTGLQNFFHDFEELIALGEDIKSGDWNKFWSDVRKYEVDIPQGLDPNRPRTALAYTWEDNVRNAQDKLNSLILAGASDDEIKKAKQDLLDAEKKLKEETERLKEQTEANANAAADLTATMTNFALTLSGGGTGGGAGFNLRSGYGGAASGSSPFGSWQKYTEFGPGVPGDRPGERNYDYNSYHGIGAYGHLQPGDVAMHPAWAWQHYHVKPGGLYTSDRDHQLHRFMDKSGARNPENEDFFKSGSSKPAVINFTYSPNLYAIDHHGVKTLLDSHGEQMARHLKRIFEDGSSADMVTA
jgi:hypothetical protein